MDPQAETNEAPVTPQPIPELPKKDNHGITIAAMAIFVLLALGAVAFLYYQNQQLKTMLAGYQASASPTPTATTDPTANWKVYINDFYSFSFKYPANISQDKNGSVGGTFLGSPKSIISFADQSTIREATDAPFDGFTIYQLSYSDSSIESFLKKEVAARKASPRGIENEEIKNITIDGKNSFYIDVEINIRQYFIPSSNNKIILFSTVRRDEDFLLILDQVLSTFKFISPTASPSAKPVACTMEAKICPDGSSVGRTGPNCEFAPCPY